VEDASIRNAGKRKPLTFSGACTRREAYEIFRARISWVVPNVILRLPGSWIANESLMTSSLVLESRSWLVHDGSRRKTLMDSLKHGEAGRSNFEVDNVGVMQEKTPPEATNAWPTQVAFGGLESKNKAEKTSQTGSPPLYERKTRPRNCSRFNM
jgi:hypothetical protein